MEGNGRATTAFMRQLKRMFEEENEDITWDKGVIVIPDPARLEKILPAYYKTSKQRASACAGEPHPGPDFGRKKKSSARNLQKTPKRPHECRKEPRERRDRAKRVAERIIESRQSRRFSSFQRQLNNFGYHRSRVRRRLSEAHRATLFRRP